MSQLQTSSDNQEEFGKQKGLIGNCINAPVRSVVPLKPSECGALFQLFSNQFTAAKMEDHTFGVLDLSLSNNEIESSRLRSKSPELFEMARLNSYLGPFVSVHGATLVTHAQSAMQQFCTTKTVPQNVRETVSSNRSVSHRLR